jgi:hypothetical protein
MVVLKPGTQPERVMKLSRIDRYIPTVLSLEAFDAQQP